MRTAIVGIGTWLPKMVRDNSAWPDTFGKRSDMQGDRTFNDIPESSDPIAAAILARDLAKEADDPFLGSRHRHVASDQDTAADAEVEAARRALAEAQVPAEDVDLVLSHSMVPDRPSFATGSVVADRLGAKHALAVIADAACASTVVQLSMAKAYLESGMAKVALLTQSHLMLRTMPHLHPAAPGLGDAASALVLMRSQRGLSLRSVTGVTHGDHAASVSWIRGMDDESDSSWWLGSGNFRLGSRFPDQAKQLMRETVSFGAATVRAAAEQAGIDVERLDTLVSVQPRGFIPSAIAERLGLPRGSAVDSYSEIAHVGACGPIFNLHKARGMGRLKPGALVAMYAQGIGFTRMAAVLEAC